MGDIQNDIKRSYDELTYTSKAFPQCSPLRLEACAALLGIEPASSQNARILEIGCSFGGNLIPFALHNPNAKLVGVDLSGEQIRRGREILSEIGIKNLTLVQKDICKFSAADVGVQKFDYIIAHGVYSWVPDFVKEAILRVVKENLSQNGVAFISYNTYPGWKVKDILRDLMLLASKHEQSAQGRLRAAKEALKIYEKHLQDKVQSGSIEKQMPALALLSWLDIIKTQEDHYILHEYLEHVNDPFYFKDFAGDLDKNGLAYLCESDLSDIFRPDLGASDVDTYKNEKFKDRIESEQLLDFLTNRAFRQSLIVHKDAYAKVADKQIGPSDLNKLHIMINFKKEDGSWLNADDKYMPENIDWLCEVFHKMYPASINLSQILELLPEQKLNVYLAFLKLLSANDNAALAMKEFKNIEYEPGRSRLKPYVADYLKYFLNHEKPDIAFASELNFNENIQNTDYLIGLEFDGKNSIEQIGAMFAAYIKKNKMRIYDNDKEIKGEKINKYALRLVKETAKLFSALFLFEEI
ncbi:class I SAM-dependent methyltransferase [Campylobacter curvus]|uniref:SAM-dependent methyltransferase n=3 Tax=Campylobacter curvus TaxID=200 RepID=A7H0I9_CAMC5|nr:class I SAM-dependent methyltransferase [Campylobacter curvus]EAU01434.1 SAM-dependent methyltransferase [Campylobacter curvus 525.92]